MKILNNDQFQEYINITRNLIASDFEPEDIDINFCSADGETIFHYAVRTNNLNLLSCLINKFPKPESMKIKIDRKEPEKIVGFNTKNSQGVSPLELALLNNQFEIAKLLLIKENQHLIGPDYQGTTLHLAIISGYLNIAETIISKNDYSALSSSDNNGNTALQLALLNNQFEIAKLLAIKKNSYPIKQDYQGNILHLALITGEYDTALNISRNFINRNNINEVDNLGRPALNLALSYKQPEIAKVLLQKGANHRAMTKHKMTPLHYAALHGYYDIAKNIIDLRTAIDAKDSEKTTALHKALCSNHLEIAQLLIARGADIKATVLKYLMTTLHLAVKYEKQQRDIMVKYLLDNGLNINAQDKRGNTPLHHALLENQTNLAKLLIERGADLAIKNLDGKTVRDLATEKNNTEVLAILDAKKLEYEKNRSSNEQTTEITTYSATNQPHADHEKESTQSFAAREAEKRANSSRKRGRCDSED